MYVRNELVFTGDPDTAAWRKTDGKVNPVTAIHLHPKKASQVKNVHERWGYHPISTWSVVARSGAAPVDPLALYPPVPSHSCAGLAGLHSMLLPHENIHDHIFRRRVTRSGLIHR